MPKREDDTELNAADLIGKQVQFKALSNQDAGSIPEWHTGTIVGVSVRVEADTLPRLKIFYNNSRQIFDNSSRQKKAYIFGIDLTRPFTIFGQVLSEGNE